MECRLSRRQPIAWLAGTPFEDYVVPGVLLAGGVGGSAVAAAVAAARRSPRWAELTAASGAVLIGWVLAEIALLDQPSATTPIERGYLALGAGLEAGGVAARARRA